MAQGWGAQAKPSGLTELRRQNWESEKVRVATVHRAEARKGGSWAMWATVFLGCSASLTFCLCQDDACVMLVCDACPVRGEVRATLRCGPWKLF